MNPSIVVERLRGAAMDGKAHESWRSALSWAVKLTVFAVSGVAAFLLRFDFVIPPRSLAHLYWGLAIWLAVKPPVFYLYGVHRAWWRFVCLPDVMRIGAANLTGSVAACALIVTLAPSGFPRSVYLLDLMLCFLMGAGIRVASRIAAESACRGHAGTRRRSLIYGAGEAGILLIRESRTNPKFGYLVCGLIDDDPSKQRLRIHGLQVLGRGEDLPQIAERGKIEMVLIALPSATGVEMTRILRCCHEARVEARTIPSLAEIVDRKDNPRSVREVSMEDLLGRNPVHLEQDEIGAQLEGRVVLITGAAGSIGSELCRQAAKFNPVRILGYDISETGLFYMGLEMRSKFPRTNFVELIGNVQNRSRLAQVFERYKPGVVFHAAAYKHVPMMEANAFEAVENNVLGTYNVARAAAEAGSSRFVLISTDKAVNPASIMGATKRVAEILTRSLNGARTTFVSVRFGNVLGSNGSVIPIFKQQIAAGGPLTLTHPEMRRYFMTIPEAAQLVLHSMAMGRGGEIFVLEMGEPVKILDLARNLILVSGLQPDRDIQIEFTGIRPGEKLYEEVNSIEESTAPTRHGKIRIYTGGAAGAGQVARGLQRLEKACVARDLPGLVRGLKDVAPEYQPGPHLLYGMREESAEEAAACAASGV